MDRRSARGERGFSLLELMIAVVILGVITSQMFVALSTQQRSSTSTGRDMDLQEAARLVADLIAFDTRNAGMMVPPEAAVASADGGIDGPDRFCVSATNYFRVEPGLFWDNRKERFLGAEVDVTTATVLTAVDASGINAADQIDIDTVRSANDWNPTNEPNQPLTGIILARRDGLGSHCALVTGLVTTAGPPTFTLHKDHGVPGDLTNGLSGTRPRLAAVPAIVYELQPGEDGEPGTLLRNGVPVSGQIEDLQIEYWVDTRASATTSHAPDGKVQGAADGSAEFPVHRLLRLPAPVPESASDPTKGAHTPLSRIRNVRISVVARGTLPDADSQGINRGRRPALANRRADEEADSFSRRMYSVSVLPRNLLRADFYTAVD
jgi:prepilin-type N-terminal cleavage/methylation domain-containing protein